MKAKIRAIGVDDAPFSFSDENVLVIGSLVRAPNYLEGVLSTEVSIDGTDGTGKLIEMIRDSRFYDQAKVIFIDGAALGGFNMIDLERLHKKTGIPAISITRDEPDFDSIKSALKAHFTDWKEKFEIVSKGEVLTVDTPHKPIFVKIEGLESEEAERIIDLFTVRGRLPEPLRISHIIASGVVRGESKGKP